MPSPFPGVDPYLEAQGYWLDFRHAFINYLQEALADRVSDHYDIRIDERMNLARLPAEENGSSLPNMMVDRRDSMSSAQPGPTSATVVEPVTIAVAILDEYPEAYIKILHRPDRALVAVLEVLSPGNKTGLGRDQYLAKRNAILRQPVHLVELDFLVGGRRLPMGRPLPPADYYALVARVDRRPDCEVYAWSVRQPLPRIKVPLLPPDPDVDLDLAAVFTTAFERGRYARSIDYTAPLAIPLVEGDGAWAEERARGGGR